MFFQYIYRLDVIRECDSTSQIFSNLKIMFFTPAPPSVGLSQTSGSGLLGGCGGGFLGLRTLPFPRLFWFWLLAPFAGWGISGRGGAGRIGFSMTVLVEAWLWELPEKMVVIWRCWSSASTGLEIWRFMGSFFRFWLWYSVEEKVFLRNQVLIRWWFW